MTSPQASGNVVFFVTPNTLYLYPLPFTSPIMNHSLNSSSSSRDEGGGDGGGGGGGGMEVWMGKVAYLSVLSVVVVLGNMLVIASIVLLRSMHRVTNYFLLSLATADLMVGVVTIPLFILWLINHEVFRQGLSCNAVLLSCLFVMAASQLNVVAVTIERYLAVCHPFYHRRALLSKPRGVTVIVGGLWLVSFLATVLSSLAIDTGQDECRYYSYFNRSFLLVLVLVGVFLPFTLILALNLRMLVQIRSSRVFKQDMYRPPPRQLRRGSLSGGMNKATSMVMTVCCLFLLAWTPFFSVILVHTFCSSCHLCHALDLILLFAFTNSAWNPLLYAFCNLKFRNAYAQILTMCCCPLSSDAAAAAGRRDSVFLLLQGRCSADKRRASQA